ncbi:MAG TPA: hypothetical protein VIL69_04235 [Roseomonas sp.]
MSDGPAMLSLDAELEAADLAAAVTLVMEACREVPGLPAPRGWRGDDEEAHPATEPVNKALHGVTLAFGSPHEDGAVFRGEEPRRFTFGLDSRQDDRPAAALRPTLHGMAALLTALAMRGVLRRAVVRRLEGGHCLPVLPLVEDATHLLACPVQEIEGSYTDPAPFAAGWDATEKQGALRIHRRAMEELGNPDFLRRILPTHMAMARAARPGTIRFYPPRFAEGEFAVLEAGEPTLTGIGYDASNGSYEFAGHIPSGTDLRCLDLLAAWRIASRGEIEGRPVREVRAVFMDAEQARRGAPLLRAAGVIPCWEDGTGHRRRLEGSG